MARKSGDVKDETEGAGEGPDPREPAPTREDAAAMVGIGPGQVLDFKVYPDRMVVVTTDGRKLEARP